LSTLISLNKLKPRQSVVGRTFDVEMAKHFEDEKADEREYQRRATLLCDRHAPSPQMQHLNDSIEQIYAEEETFTFKSLKPWVILQPGDAFHAVEIGKLCEKQYEEVQFSGRIGHH
jgi:hypothetical protein